MVTAKFNDVIVRGWLVFNGAWHNVMPGSQMVFFNKDRDVEVYEYLYINGDARPVSMHLFCKGQHVPVNLKVAHVEFLLMLNWIKALICEQQGQTAIALNNRKLIETPSRN